MLDLHQRAAAASLTDFKEARETIRTAKRIQLSGGFSSIRDMADLIEQQRQWWRTWNVAAHSNRQAARGSAESVSLDSFRMPSKPAWLSAGQNAASVMPSGRVYSTLNTALFNAMKLA